MFPSIMQFVSPDTLIPDPYNPLDWNRYAYVRYNPLKYTDPTGHTPGPACSAVCQWLTQTYQNAMQTIGRTVVYPNNVNKEADNVGGLMVLALFQEPSATITGDALDDIAGDKTMQAKQKNMIDQITADPRYGKENFDGGYDPMPITFGEMGNNNMLEDAHHSQTWTVRAANVKTKFNVTKAGDITLNYTLSDTLDLVPDWENRTGVSGFFYNIVTTATGAVWHGLLGARKMNTNASWSSYTKKDWLEER